MKKREASFQIQFRHWLKKNPMVSGAFELKQTTSKNLSFDLVKEHQINALMASSSNVGFLYKLPDDSISTKPYDCFYLRNAKAYIVIKYPSCFVIIDVYDFMREKEISDSSSLSEIRAKEIAHIVVS